MFTAPSAPEWLYNKERNCQSNEGNAVNDAQHGCCDSVVIHGMLSTTTKTNQDYVPPQLPPEIPVYNSTPIEIFQQVVNEIPPLAQEIPLPITGTSAVKEIPPPSKENIVQAKLREYMLKSLNK